WDIRSRDTSDIYRVRLSLSGGVDTAVWTFQNSTIAGIVLSGDLTLNAQNLVVDTTTGTQFSTADNQKISFHGETPIIRETLGANDVASVITALVNLGLINAAP
ncbi:hypothetical protein LCGC14_1400610, partial [marine sediment metagenome]